MKDIQKTIGYVLLFPPVLSVLLFTINLFIKDSGDIARLYNLSNNWTGDYVTSGESAAGFSSTIPLYFGLMAIAGAYLIKSSDEK